jgi:hypothetical protein
MSHDKQQPAPKQRIPRLKKKRRVPRADSLAAALFHQQISHAAQAAQPAEQPDEQPEEKPEGTTG